MDVITTVIKGTELKYKLEIESEGFSMVADNFKVELYNNRFHKEITKEEMIVEQPDPLPSSSSSSSSSSEEEPEEPEYYFIFDTAEFGTGEITMKVTAWVPDFAFPDSLRTEVWKKVLLKVIN